MVLEVRKLSKRIGDQVILNGLSFSVGKGEVVGLLGPNGAGKTTAFYLTVGLVKPDSGQVLFNHHDVTHIPMHKRSQMGMGYLTQEPSIFRGLSVEDNLLCILETVEKDKERRRERLEKLLDELDLTALAKKPAVALSGGERRRLEITRALITNPQLLLLDEPFANIDPITIADVKAMIRHLTSKGISVLITDHNAREIFSIVDRSYLILEGRLLISGPVETLAEDPTVRRIYLGQDFKF